MGILKSRRLFLPLAALLIFNPSLVTSSFALGWYKAKSDHFVVYYGEEKNFVQEVLYKAEIYYRRIAQDLGYPRYSEFWLWGRRAKIYIYPDREAYLEATGEPEWSEGTADYTQKQIISYAGSEDFLNSVLPHEMAHLIFREFVGFQGEVPLWLDEGVAQWAESATRERAMTLAKELYEKDGLLSLRDMMLADIRKLDDNREVYVRANMTKSGKPGALFLSADELINVYYIQSVSLVGFLIDRYGTRPFTFFCQQLRDGKNFEEALRFAYPETFTGIGDFERTWRRYLRGEKGGF